MEVITVKQPIGNIVVELADNGNCNKCNNFNKCAEQA